MNFDNLVAEWYARPAVWSYGIAALAFTAFGVQLVLGWKGAGRGLLLLSAIALGAVWAIASAGFAIAPDPELWRAANIVDVFRLACAAAFLTVVLFQGNLTQSEAAPRRKAIGVYAAISFAVGVLLFADVPMPGSSDGDDRSTGWAFEAHLVIALLGVVLAEQIYRHAAPELRWQLRPLCIGIAGPLALDVVVFSDALLYRVLDLHFWEARGFAHSLSIPLLVLAANRNRDWTFDVSVSRSVVAGSTAVLVAGAYLLVVAASGYYVRYFGGAWGKALQTVLFFAACLALGFIALSSTFRARVRVFVAKHFFSYRYDYREEWLRFTQTLSTDDQGRSVETICLHALAGLVESAGGGLWLRRDASSGFVQVARFRQRQVGTVEPTDGALHSFLGRTGWVIEVPAARRDPASHGGLGLPGWLDPLQEAWLIVPLLVTDELIGFVILDKPRVKIEVGWEVRDLLKTAGRQAAGYLAMKQATEALVEAQKFEAFNRMSAFVVHDLKNLITQMQLMLRNAQKHQSNPEFQRDMLETVENVVERMNALMRQLRAGGSPAEGPRSVDLSALVDRVCAARSAERIEVRREGTGPAVANGHEDRLERVIGHLVQNALEAGGENARVVVRLLDAPEQCVVEVTDNGSGMSSDFVRERLFKPFQTTKSTGMGIGAYESQQYVSSLGGRIEVKTEQGAGTQVRVVLPGVKTAASAMLSEQPI